MNVIVSNKNQLLLENLGIDIIKEMNGEFEVDEIIATFQNFFYQRMILDITSIKNYTDIVNLQKLSISLDMEKIILYWKQLIRHRNVVRMILLLKQKPVEFVQVM